MSIGWDEGNLKFPRGVCFSTPPAQELSPRTFPIDQRVKMGLPSRKIGLALERKWACPPRKTDRPNWENLLRICLDFTANKFYVILFSLFETLYTIFTLFVLANRPLFAATKQCKSVQKHLSTKLEIKSKQILRGEWKSLHLIFPLQGSVFMCYKSRFVKIC